MNRCPTLCIWFYALMAIQPQLMHGPTAPTRPEFFPSPYERMRYRP